MRIIQLVHCTRYIWKTIQCRMQVTWCTSGTVESLLSRDWNLLVKNQWSAEPILRVKLFWDRKPKSIKMDMECELKMRKPYLSQLVFYWVASLEVWRLWGEKVKKGFMLYCKSSGRGTLGIKLWERSSPGFDQTSQRFFLTKLCPFHTTDRHSMIASNLFIFLNF